MKYLFLSVLTHCEKHTRCAKKWLFLAKKTNFTDFKSYRRLWAHCALLDLADFFNSRLVHPEPFGTTLSRMPAYSIDRILFEPAELILGT